MVTFDPKALLRPLPDRKLKLFFVGVGLSFWLAWGIAIFFLVDGHPLQGVDACGPFDETGIFWECASGRIHALIASSANAIIVLTVAMPVFLLAASVEPAAMQLALPGLMFHLVGLPTGMFVLVRSLRRLIEHARARTF